MDLNDHSQVSGDNEDKPSDLAYEGDVKSEEPDEEMVARVKIALPEIYEEVRALKTVFSSLDGVDERIRSELKRRLDYLHASKKVSCVKSQWIPDFTPYSFCLDDRLVSVNTPPHSLYQCEEDVVMSWGNGFDPHFVEHTRQYLATVEDVVGDICYDRLFHIAKMHRIMPRPPRSIIRARLRPGDGDSVNPECLSVGEDHSVFVFVKNELYYGDEERPHDPQPSSLLDERCTTAMEAHHEAAKALIAQLLPHLNKRTKITEKKPQASPAVANRSRKNGRSSAGATSRESSPTLRNHQDTVTTEDSSQDDDGDDSDDEFYYHCELPYDNVSAISSAYFPTSDTSPEEQNILQQAALEDVRYAPFFLSVKPSFCFMNLPVIFEFPLKVGLEAEESFPLANRSVIAGRYVIMDTIGTAAFSRAIEVYDLVSESRICLKVMHNQKDLVDQCLDEVKMLRLLNSFDPHDMFHIVRLRGCFYFKEHLFLASELLGGNLHDATKIVWDQRSLAQGPRLQNYFYFSLKVIRKIARQILISLWYLRCFGLLHCDLKPENILMQDWATSRVKLIDFGSASFLHDSMTSYIQSRSYRAPEVILGVPTTLPSAIDMWSLGCIQYEIFTNQVLFSTRAIPIILANMQSLLGPFPPHMIHMSRFGPRYFRAVPVPMPQSHAHMGSNALVFQTFQRRSVVKDGRNSVWRGQTPVEGEETSEQTYQRRNLEEQDWAALDNIGGPLKDEASSGNGQWEEALLDPQPSSLLQKIVKVCQAQQDSIVAAGGTACPKMTEALREDVIASTCHPTKWPGYQLRMRDWTEDNPARIAQFITRRKHTTKRGRAGVVRELMLEKTDPKDQKLDVEAIHSLLTDQPVTDDQFPANPAFPRPQFFGQHHPAMLAPHDSPALFANFLSQLLRYQPEERPSPEQALLHPFLWPVDDDEEWDL